MNRISQHQRSHAGTSYTKACVAIRCVSMRPVVSNWT